MCEYCEFEDFLETIDEMMEESKYEFAMETIEGIKEWVLEHGHCTKKQKEAIKNIAEGAK